VDFTRYGAEIAAIVGLFTIAGFLWRLFVKIRDTMEVVVKVPPKLEETGRQVEAVKDQVAKVDAKVDLMALQHLATNEQTHTALVRLETAHTGFDNRLRGVEQGIEVVKDRTERPERPDGA
jgi:hypothetical protein